MRKRANIRFQPETLTVAKVRLHTKQNEPFLSVVRDECYRGCSLILQSTTGLRTGMFCQVKAGELPELPARVAWVAPLKDGFIKAGFEYLA
ncbi:MAG: hypothetical protein JST16_05845 [Bdellovibrionales bacterium]|nr:hypothetical protein [Bdellovibrionales bacterium]